MSRLLARNAVKIRLWNNKMITSNTYRALILFYKLIHRVDLIKSTVSPILEMRKLNSERLRHLPDITQPETAKSIKKNLKPANI